MLKITVVGAGYVGLVTGACLAEFGNIVTCADTDVQKIDLLTEGRLSVYEPGLEDMVRRNISHKRLNFTHELKKVVNNCEIIFIAVGTPAAEDGSADLRYINSAIREIGTYSTGYKIIINKSTVPIGTCRNIAALLEEEKQKRIRSGEMEAETIEYDIVSNPEFLREGSAIHDFMEAERVVIGTESETARGLMKNIYRPLYVNQIPFIETSVETAETIKYAVNTFLAVKISFVNEIANLCEKVGANILDVTKAMGKDTRIGEKFLRPGPGYGGSCFPKDTRAFVSIANKHKSPLTIVERTIEINNAQKKRMSEKIIAAAGSLKNKTVAVLGLSYKPDTADMRESPSITIIRDLVKEGARINAIDPEAINEAKKYFQDIAPSITYFDDEYEAMRGAGALVIITEWSKYTNLDLNRVKSLLASPLFFDFRNIYKRNYIEDNGLIYYGVGQ